MTNRRPQTISFSTDPKDRVLPVSSDQQAFVAEHSTAHGPEDLAISLQMRGMESWLALINASTWLDLAEDQKAENT